MSTETKRAGGRIIEVSKADKVLFPDDGITKAGLATYYQQVAGMLTRYTRDRPDRLVNQHRPAVAGRGRQHRTEPAGPGKSTHAELPEGKASLPPLRSRAAAIGNVSSLLSLKLMRLIRSSESSRRSAGRPS